jgi:competence protein ComEA
MRTYSPKQSRLLLSLASLLFLASLFTTLSERPASDAALQRNPSNVSIEIAGEVRNPGIYSFPGQVTVKRVLLEAEGAEGGNIANSQVLTQVLDTGSKIVVMRGQKHILTVKVTLIPGIGPRLAQRIIRYRSKKGGFRDIDELKGVRGIGEKKLRSLERYLTVRK